jgi:putative membrane protein
MPEIRLPYSTVVSILLGLFLIEFAVLAIHPVDRSAWLLENMLVVVVVAVLVATYRRFRLSRISYTLIFLFLALHEIGSHYTYSLVPYDAFFTAVFGTGLNEIFGWERNHFDRFLHFAYGLLLVYPVREVFLRVVDVRGFWGYALPLDVVMSTSMIYELIEWGAAALFGGDLGVHYLGTQGDQWDAQKDMLLATLGAFVAMGITLAINGVLQRDFAAEWVDSLRVKHTEPLGEDAIARMLDDD